MAKKYHVGPDGKVSECTARFRPCPYDDYQTKEGAATAYELKLEKQDLDARRKKVSEFFEPKNFNTLVQSRAIIDFSGNSRGKRFRDYGNILENSFLAHCKDPEAYSVTTYLNHDEENRSVDVSAQRTLVPNFNEGKIAEVWEIKIKGIKSYNKHVDEKIRVDFDVDSAQGMREVRTFLEEAARLNPISEDSSIDAETDKLFKNFRKNFAMVEEEAKGPAWVWENYGIDEGLGTFAHSDSDRVIAFVDYNGSAFRARSVERFLEENGYYKVGTPEIGFRINDIEEDGSAGWYADYLDGTWTLALQRKNSKFVEKYILDDHEEAERLLSHFVRENMNNNTERAAREKAEYVSTFMLQMEPIQKKAEERGEAFTNLIRTSGKSNQAEKSDELFGETKKDSTIGKILGLFS